MEPPGADLDEQNKNEDDLVNKLRIIYDVE